jgi:(2Fe-2S) ferredoxin
MTEWNRDATEFEEARKAYCLEVCRDGEWHVVGQYREWYQAERIAEDYRARGERVRVIGD